MKMKAKDIKQRAKKMDKDRDKREDMKMMKKKIKKDCMK